VSDSDRNLSSAHVHLGDLAEFVGGLLLGDAVKDVATFDVVKEAKAIATLFEFNDIHESGRVVFVRPDLAVHLDTALHANLLALFARQGILEAIAENNAHGQTLSEFVGSRRRAGGPNAHHFAEIPMLGSMEAFQMLLGSARPTVIVEQKM
jgi:hypothetical protein